MMKDIHIIRVTTKKKYSEEEPSFNEIKELAKNYEQQQNINN